MKGKGTIRFFLFQMIPAGVICYLIIKLVTGI